MPDSTIYDVADRAGVSISTVSRVINTPGQVQEATRQRVLAVIDELGFVPRAEAIARARKGIRRVGVMTPFFTAPSFVVRLRGVAKALADSGYELVVYNVESALQRDSQLASLPISRRLDGLIVMSLPFSDAAAQRLLSNQLETVLVEFTHAAFNSIWCDDVEGGRLAARHFAELGRRRCAFIGDDAVPPYALPFSARRLQGYREELARHGQPLREEYVSRLPHGLEQAYQQARQLLSLPEPPDAIFAASDLQAMGVLKAAREHGVAVPAEIAVVGYDDIDAAEYVGLTTVRQPLEESGRIAVELLLARLSDPARPPQQVLLPLQVIRRETA